MQIYGYQIHVPVRAFPIAASMDEATNRRCEGDEGASVQWIMGY